MEQQFYYARFISKYSTFPLLGYLFLRFYGIKIEEEKEQEVKVFEKQAWF